MDRKAGVRTEYGETEWFSIGQGVIKRCILSPYLFNLDAEHIQKTGLDAKEGGVKVGGRKSNGLR